MSELNEMYFDVSEVFNKVVSDIMTISDKEVSGKLMEESNEARKPIFAFLGTLEKAKEDCRKTETYELLPEIVIKAKFENNQITLRDSRDYVNDSIIGFLNKEHRDMIHDFIYTYASHLRSAFLIVDGNCLTTRVSHNHVIFGKYKFLSITVEIVA